MKLKTQKKYISVISTAIFAFMSTSILASDTESESVDLLNQHMVGQIEVSPYQNAILKYQNNEAKMAALLRKLEQENLSLIDTSLFTRPSEALPVTDEQMESVSRELEDFFGHAYLEDAHVISSGHDISYIEALQSFKRQEWLGEINQALIEGEQEQYGGMFFDAKTQKGSILLPHSASASAKRMAESLRQTPDIGIIDTRFTLLEMENEGQRIMVELKKANPDIKVRTIPDLKSQKLLVQVEASQLAKQQVADMRKSRFKKLKAESQRGVDLFSEGVAHTIPVDYLLVDKGTLNVQRFKPKTTGNRIFWSPTTENSKRCSSSFHVVSQQGHQYGSSNSHCLNNISFSGAIDGTQGTKKFAFGFFDRGPRREHLIDLAFYDYPGHDFLPETRWRHGDINARDSKGEKISAREIRRLSSRGELFPGVFVCKFGATTGRTCGDIIAIGRWDKFQPDNSTLPGLETLMIGSLPEHGHAVFSAPGDSGSGIYTGYNAVATMWGGYPTSDHQNIPHHPGLTDITWAIPTWYAQNHLFNNIRGWHNIVRTYSRDNGGMNFTSFYDNKWNNEISSGFNPDLDYYYVNVDNAPLNCTDYGLSVVEVREKSITCGLPIPSLQSNPSGRANNTGVPQPRMTAGVAGSGSGQINGKIFGVGISSGGVLYGGSSKQQNGRSHSNGTAHPKATVTSKNGDNCSVRWCQHVRPTPRYGLAGMEHGFGWEQTFNQTVSCAALNNLDTIELARHDRIQEQNGDMWINLVPNHRWVRDPNNIPNDLKCTTMREYFAN